MKTQQGEDKSQKRKILEEDGRSRVFRETESEFQFLIMISNDDDSPKETEQQFVIYNVKNKLVLNVQNQSLKQKFITEKLIII